MDKYKITHDTWNKIAELYEEHFMDLDIYNESYQDFCEALAQKTTVLELGCGPGNITRFLLKQRPDLKVDATDIAPNMIDLGKKNVPHANFFKLDVREIKSLKKTYDAIMMGFTLPYLSQEDLRAFLGDARSILNKEGIIYLSCIEGDYSNSSYQEGSSGDRTFVYYYSHEELLKDFTQHDYKILNNKRISFPRKNGEEEIHLIYLIQKI